MPSRLNGLKGTRPILLVFAPSEKSPAFENQISLLRSDRLVEEGDLTLIQVLKEGACYADGEKLDEQEAEELRDEFAVSDDTFAVILLDRSGGEVYRGDAPVQPDFLRDGRFRNRLS